MREIKFRAWDGVNMRNVENICFSGTPTITFRYKPVVKAPIHSCELMQYTGLKDKNGVEVYEGDVVSILDKTTRQAPYIGDVRWNDIVTGYEAHSPELSYGLFLHGHPMITAPLLPELKKYIGKPDQRTIEVIGNIYANPELLS